jgi:hypothetical protein
MGGRVEVWLKEMCTRVHGRMLEDTHFSNIHVARAKEIFAGVEVPSSLWLKALILTRKLVDS